MWPVPDLRAFLSGRWRIDRTITDRRHSISGKMLGEAQFCGAGGSLTNIERGILTFGAHLGPAEQTYHYDFADGNARASVRFRDGRPFYELDLSEGHGAVVHDCDRDRYDGHFIVLEEDRWQANWTVVGPRKDQDIVTLYTRRR